MIVLISQKVIRDKHGTELDALETSYVDFFKKEVLCSDVATLIPVPNDPENAARLTLALTPKLIILSGGNNINPQSFGSDIALDDMVPTRDATEKVLFDYAVSNAIPLLGVCRGFQFINIQLKGKLTLNITDHPPAVQHVCLYDGKKYTINSFHNHGVFAEDVAPELYPVIVESRSGIVEAYSGKIMSKVGSSRILGVQWHPERPGADTDLFKKMIKKYLFPGEQK